MDLLLPYGSTGLRVELPDGAYLAVPQGYRQESADPVDLVGRAITVPLGCPRLREIATGKRTAAIVINDATRPYPARMLVEALLVELRLAGIQETDVTLIVATGNHRPCTHRELTAMLGPELLSRLRVVNHNAQDYGSLVYIGSTPAGIPIWVNRCFVDAQVKILTGLIAPHPAAGYSGGPKSVLPGISGLETLRIHHSFPFRPYKPALGRALGNPFYEEALSAARQVGVDFILNVILGPGGEVAGVVAGEVGIAHRRGMEICEQLWAIRIPHLFDAAIVTPGGYPRDRDLYQAQKAVAAAEMVCRPGGPIVLVAELREGLGWAATWLEKAYRPEDVVERFRTEGYTKDASAKCFMWARALTSHPVLVVSDRVSPGALRALFLTPAQDMREALRFVTGRLGGTGRLVVMPFACSIVPLVGEDRPPS